MSRKATNLPPRSKYPMVVKLCAACGETREHMHDKVATGLQLRTRCYVCRRNTATRNASTAEAKVRRAVAGKSWRKNNPDLKREHDATWRASDKGRACIAATRTAERSSAYQAVMVGLTKDTLTRPTACPRCNEPERFDVLGRSMIHAHHARGYDREHRTDIEWLCALCHAAEHAEDH